MNRDTTPFGCPTLLSVRYFINHCKEMGVIPFKREFKNWDDFLSNLKDKNYLNYKAYWAGWHKEPIGVYTNRPYVPYFNPPPEDDILLQEFMDLERREVFYPAFRVNINENTLPLVNGLGAYSPKMGWDTYRNIQAIDYVLPLLKVSNISKFGYPLFIDDDYHSFLALENSGKMTTPLTQRKWQPWTNYLGKTDELTEKFRFQKGEKELVGTYYTTDQVYSLWLALNHNAGKNISQRISDYEKIAFLSHKIRFYLSESEVIGFTEYFKRFIDIEGLRKRLKIKDNKDLSIAKIDSPPSGVRGRWDFWMQFLLALQKQKDKAGLISFNAYSALRSIPSEIWGAKIKTEARKNVFVDEEIGKKLHRGFADYCRYAKNPNDQAVALAGYKEQGELPYYKVMTIKEFKTHRNNFKRTVFPKINELKNQRAKEILNYFGMTLDDAKQTQVIIYREISEFVNRENNLSDRELWLYRHLFKIYAYLQLWLGDLGIRSLSLKELSKKFKVKKNTVCLCCGKPIYNSFAGRPKIICESGICHKRWRLLGSADSLGNFLKIKHELENGYKNWGACKQCGKSYEITKRTKKRLFCSRKCKNLNVIRSYRKRDLQNS